MSDLESTLAERVDAFTPVARPAFGELVKRRRRRRAVRASAAVTVAVAAATIGLGAVHESMSRPSLTTVGGPSTSPSPQEPRISDPVTSKALAGTWMIEGESFEGRPSGAGYTPPGTLVITEGATDAVDGAYDGRILFYDGCNSSGGWYEASPSGELVTHGWSTTLVGCSGHELGRDLWEPRRVEIDGGRIVFVNGEGRRTAFRRVR